MTIFLSFLTAIAFALAGILFCAETFARCFTGHKSIWDWTPTALAIITGILLLCFV